LELNDDDWAWIISPHGRVKAQIKRLHGVNPDTVWTWNAIGKRRGTWGLDTDAPEASKGFLLNHIISELLPARADGHRYANADPVTGQAAWYDLRVRLEKCLPAEVGETAPQFATVPPTPAQPPAPQVLRYGAAFDRRPTGAGPEEHLEWVGNRREYAAAETGVRPGHGNRTGKPVKGEAS
jgi:hypothetical protein